MPTLKITDKAAERIAVKAGQKAPVLYWDSTPTRRGFGVIVHPSGAKSYIVQRDIRGTGKTRRVVIGRVGVRSAEDAYAKAKQLLRMMEDGHDPVEVERQAEQAKHDAEAAEQRESVTLRQALDSYLQSPKGVELRPKSVALYKAALARYSADWLDKPLRAITRDDVEARYGQILARVSGKERNSERKWYTGKGSAAFWVHTLGIVWRYRLTKDAGLGAAPTDVLADQGVKLALKPRESIVLAPTWPKLFQAVDAVANPNFRAALLTVMFTALRLDIVEGLEWREVDLPGRLLRLPAARMKSKRDFELPICPYIADVLTAHRAIGHRGRYVFPSTRSGSGHITTLRDELQKLARKHGLRTNIGSLPIPHDFRRCLLSLGTDLGIPEVVTGRLIDHTSKQGQAAAVTIGYIISTEDSLRKAADRIGEAMMDMCGIQRPAGVVVLSEHRQEAVAS